LEHLRALHAGWATHVVLEPRAVSAPGQAGTLLAQLPGGSLVVNATGAGKDTPGSPLADDAVFPPNGYAWEFNYRGELHFLAQARAQQATRGLHVEDGWRYFLHGWTSVIADVFACDLSPHGRLFDDLAGIAAELRG
jgi:shikimate 5-dehydrogenase